MSPTMPFQMHASDYTLLTTTEMALADSATIALGTTEYDLMYQAGQQVARAIQANFTKRHTLVLCGPGNNGGDGYVVAKQLADAGWPVQIGYITESTTLPASAQAHASAWQGTSQPLAHVSLDTIELVVDALFGAGLNRPLDTASASLLAQAVERHIPIVAIDVPSGVVGDTGESLGAVQCAMTVTFFRKKPAHVLMPAKRLCGKVVLTDIGIPPQTLDTIQPKTWENHPTLWLSAWPKLESSSHKYTRGHACIEGGFPMTGAAKLAARATARIGAGLTTILAPTEAYLSYASHLLSIMLKTFADLNEHDKFTEEKRYTAFLIGPGAGYLARTEKLALQHKLDQLLKLGKPVVLDADALSIYEGNAYALKNAIQGPVVITPHEGEFKRLCSSIKEINISNRDKLSLAREAAAWLNGIVVYKGSDTVIAAPDGRAIINSHAPATLATAGSGDVLAGMITGLLAQGMPAFEAAAASVWLHAACANQFGYGLIAEDLPEQLPSVLNQLLAST